MSVLQAKMQLIAEDLAKHHGLSANVAAASDFLNWLMELARELLPMLMGCFASTDQAVSAMNNPNWFQQFRVRRFLRGQMRDSGMERRMLEPLASSFFTLGKTITKDEYMQMQSEV